MLGSAARQLLVRLQLLFTHATRHTQRRRRRTRTALQKRQLLPQRTVRTLLLRHQLCAHQCRNAELLAQRSLQRLPKRGCDAAAATLARHRGEL